MRPELSSEHVDYDALRALPETTLGGAYVRHLDRNGLTADYQAAATRHVDDPDMAYLMRRFRQTHDVWHALLGLGVTGHEEVIIHWFSYGQLRLPVSAMIMVLGSAQAPRARAPLGCAPPLRDRGLSRRPRRRAAAGGRAGKTAGPKISTTSAPTTGSARSSSAGFSRSVLSPIR